MNWARRKSESFGMRPYKKGKLGAGVGGGQVVSTYNTYIHSWMDGSVDVKEPHGDIPQ